MKTYPRYRIIKDHCNIENRKWPYKIDQQRRIWGTWTRVEMEPTLDKAKTAVVKLMKTDRTKRENILKQHKEVPLYFDDFSVELTKEEDVDEKIS